MEDESYFYIMFNTFHILDQKLLNVERLQLQKFQVNLHEDSESLQAKVLSFQRKYETQKRAELKAEVNIILKSDLDTWDLI